MATKVGDKFKNLLGGTFLGFDIFGTMSDVVQKNQRHPPKPIEVAVQDYTTMREGQYVWFGHSSLMFVKEGKHVFVDPVFGNIIGCKQHKYSAEFDIARLPVADYVLLTHNHFDHMDLKTLRLLIRPETRVVCPIGNARYLHEVTSNGQVVELNWYEELRDGAFTIQCLPARHFSGRGPLDRDKALWAGYTLGDIYVSGDTAWDAEMFAEIRQRLAIPPRFCFVEMGQYNASWANVHMVPVQSYSVFKMLGGAQFFPIHFGKYSLCFNSWNESALMCLTDAISTAFIGQIGRIYTLEDCAVTKSIHPSFLLK